MTLASGETVKLESDAGVFSASRLDPGTKILLDTVPPPAPNSRVLDGGCGYGPITIWCATAEPTATVVGVDINERALGLAEANIKQLGITNVSVAPTIDGEFDRVYSNPPARIGKAELHELLLSWLSHLTPDGDAYLVVQKHLGSDSLAEWLTTQGFSVERIASKRAFRVLHLRVQPL